MKDYLEDLNKDRVMWMEAEGHIGFIVPAQASHPVPCAYILLTEIELAKYRDKIEEACHCGLTLEQPCVGPVVVVGWDYGHSVDVIDYTKHFTVTGMPLHKWLGTVWPVDELRKDWNKVVKEVFGKKEEKKKEEKKKGKKIIRNAFRCKKCGQVVESKSVHDYEICECGNATDGGTDYISRTGNFEDMEDLSEYE